MKRVAISFFLFLIASSVYAFRQNWYFTDCTTVGGGNGLQSNPYCLDPDADGNRESFAVLADGTGVEFDTGETAYLCCGACDGGIDKTCSADSTNPGTICTTDGQCPGGACSSACVYRVDPALANATSGAPTSNTCGYYLFDPRVSGTEAQPITIRNYPGEDVTIEGDREGNRLYSNTIDLDSFITNEFGGNAKSWYVIQGIKWHYVEETLFCFKNYGAQNWTITGNTFGWANDATWGISDTAAPGTTGVGNFGCGGNPTNIEDHSFAIRIQSQTAPVSITNNTFKHICNSSLRIIGNPSPLASFTITGNTAYDANTLLETFFSGNMTVSNNTTDTHIGVSIENETHDIVVSDNNIGCSAKWHVSTSGYGGRCSAGITVNKGDKGANCAGFTHDILIERNKVWGNCTVGTAPWIQNGSAFSGISFLADCVAAHGACNDGHTPDSCSVTNYIAKIQNNWIWNIGPCSNFNGHDTGKGALELFSGSHIITAQNNTIYRSKYSVQTGPSVTGLGSPKAHLFINNTIDFGGRDSVVLFLNAIDTGIDYNSISNQGGGFVQYATCSAGDSDSCTTLVPATWTSIGTGNITVVEPSSAIFVSASSNPLFTNLHLGAGTGNLNSGTTGATTDIDGDARPSGPGTEMGADEKVQPNLLVDGDFESGAFDAARWQNDGTCVCNAVSTLGAFREAPSFPIIAGRFSMEIPAKGICQQGDGAPACSGIYHDFTGLTVGAQYMIFGKYHAIPRVTSNAKLVISFDSDPDTANRCQITVGESKVNTTFQCVLRAPAASARMRFWGTRNAVPAVNFYIDAIQVVAN